jgi:hypothetical protein
MIESINVWEIKEYEGDGVSYPIIPTHPPFHKKVFLSFFKFGICPTRVTMSPNLLLPSAPLVVLGIPNRTNTFPLFHLIR